MTAREHILKLYPELTTDDFTAHLVELLMESYATEKCKEQRDSDIEKIGNLLAAEYSDTTTINLDFELPLITDKNKK